MSLYSAARKFFPATPQVRRADGNRRPWRRPILIVLLLPLMAGALLLGGLPGAANDSAWFWAMTNGAESRPDNSLGLADYRVEIEASAIVGVDADVSGLTYDPDRDTLFTITNKRPEIIELSLQGQVLRRIPVSGLDDPEAIEYVARGHYVVTDERRQTIVELRIDDHTQPIDGRAQRQLAFAIGRNGNKGFEGLAYDRRGDRLFVAKEKDPVRIYEITGFPSIGQAPTRSLTIADNPQRDLSLPVGDLSSLHFDAQSGHLLALSDDSQRLIEIDAAGRVGSQLSLTAGRHGLQRSVPQAEGVAMDERGTLYLVSEPNLFYRFKRGN